MYACLYKASNSILKLVDVCNETFSLDIILQEIVGRRVLLAEFPFLLGELDAVSSSPSPERDPLYCL